MTLSNGIIAVGVQTGWRAAPAIRPAVAETGDRAIGSTAKIAAAVAAPPFEGATVAMGTGTEAAVAVAVAVVATVVAELGGETVTVVAAGRDVAAIVIAISVAGDDAGGDDAGGGDAGGDDTGGARSGAASLSAGATLSSAPRIAVVGVTGGSIRSGRVDAARGDGDGGAGENMVAEARFGIVVDTGAGAGFVVGDGAASRLVRSPSCSGSPAPASAGIALVGIVFCHDRPASVAAASGAARTSFAIGAGMAIGAGALVSAVSLSGRAMSGRAMSGCAMSGRAVSGSGIAESTFEAPVSDATSAGLDGARAMGAPMVTIAGGAAAMP